MTKNFEIEVKTKKGKKVYINVEGFYDKYKPMEKYNRYGDPGTPGEAASFEIRRIFFDNVDVTDHLDFIDDMLNAAIWQALENEALNFFE